MSWSEERRILAQLTEAVSAKVVLRGVGKGMAFYRNNAWRFIEIKKEEVRFIDTKYHPDSGKGGQKPDL